MISEAKRVVHPCLKARLPITRRPIAMSRLLERVPMTVRRGPFESSGCKRAHFRQADGFLGQQDAGWNAAPIATSSIQPFRS